MTVLALSKETETTDATAMQAIVHKRYGRPGPVVIDLGELQIPEIEDHQVLVRVRASSVNPVEWYGVTGPYFARIGAVRPSASSAESDLPADASCCCFTVSSVCAACSPPITEIRLFGHDHMRRGW